MRPNRSPVQTKLPAWSCEACSGFGGSSSTGTETNSPGETCYSQDKGQPRKWPKALIMSHGGKSAVLGVGHFLNTRMRDRSHNAAIYSVPFSGLWHTTRQLRGLSAQPSSPWNNTWCHMPTLCGSMQLLQGLPVFCAVGQSSFYMITWKRDHLGFVLIFLIRQHCNNDGGKNHSVSECFEVKYVIKLKQQHVC